MREQPQFSDRSSEDSGHERADPVALFEQLLTHAEESEDDEELRRLGQLIDLSEDLERVDGIEIALSRGKDLLSRELNSEHQAFLHYFLGNAWEVRRKLTRKEHELLDWEQPELEKQIVHLRHAVQVGSGSEIEPRRICPMLTNLGNLLERCGRTIDALRAWDRALDLDPDFGMALGNRGRGLTHYASLVHDPGHQVFHLREAYTSLSRALSEKRDDVHSGARDNFAEALEHLTDSVPSHLLEPPSHEHHFPEDISPLELEYRKWCLREKLFLNDLNDLGADPIAAADVLTLPPIVTPAEAGQPSIFGFFNQLKQEYVSARYLYYEGVTTEEVHFSDRDVIMVNSFDYPAYGLAAEKVKIAFRIAYSMLDKVAYFLNDYLALGIPEKRVSFRTLWYQKRDRSRGLRPDLHRPHNSPLRGLFWLSKDLYEDKSGFTDAIEPDARAIAEIRNHLEHKYLKLHVFGSPPPQSTTLDSDSLAYSLGRREFEQRTLRLLKMVRAALLYLSQSVHVEEHQRSMNEGDHKERVPIHLDTYKDEWKF